MPSQRNLKDLKRKRRKVEKEIGKRKLNLSRLSFGLLVESFNSYQFDIIVAIDTHEMLPILQSKHMCIHTARGSSYREQIIEARINKTEQNSHESRKRNIPSIVPRNQRIQVPNPVAERRVFANNNFKGNSCRQIHLAEKSWNPPIQFNSIHPEDLFRSGGIMFSTSFFRSASKDKKHRPPSLVCRLSNTIFTSYCQSQAF